MKTNDRNVYIEGKETQTYCDWSNLSNQNSNPSPIQKDPGVVTCFLNLHTCLRGNLRLENPQFQRGFFSTVCTGLSFISS